MQLAVAGRVIAVRDAEAARQPCEAIGILSGAPMPQVADTVFM
jgi:molybdopterin biosynthesis enzyme